MAEVPARLAAYMQARREMVETALCELLPAEETPSDELHRAMRHSVVAGGKRLRPLLVLAGAEACGAEPESAMPAACAVELIHTYSLIHDDLPSFDDEELRRGVPTCHTVFGEAMAILAGDALQALAFEVMAAAADSGGGDPRAWLRAIELVARAAGSPGMCGGQAMDIRAAGRQIDVEHLRRLHAAKTGALLTASVVAGGILAGADDARVDALTDYGDAVGLAFQIVDDLLDVEGNAAELGKNPGGDAAREQPTFPALVGLQESHDEAERLRQRAHAALEPLGERAWPLADLADYIVARSR